MHNYPSLQNIENLLVGGSTPIPADMLQLIVDNLPMRIFWKDTELIYQGCNVAFAQDTGFNIVAKVIGKTDYDCPWATTQAESFRADDTAVIESGEAKVNYQERQTRPDGSDSWVQTSKIPLRDASGKIFGMLGTYEDITAQKLAAEAHEQEQQALIEAQQRTLAELSTPIIPIMEQIIIVPLIGNIDTIRARDITRDLLAGITQHRARYVILDITGVSLVDSEIAGYLDKAIQAARLKGAQTIITGISDAVAETIIDLGINWSTVETLGTLQAGLTTVMQQIRRA